MSKKSLQEQLLKAGLIDKQKAEKISRSNRKKKHKQLRHEDTAPNETQQAAQKALEEKQERDRELNRQRQEEAAKKALAAQIHQLVQHYKLSRSEADTDYNFADGNKVKTLYVPKVLVDEISRGRLCIVRLAEEAYEVIPTPIAERIMERDARVIVVNNSKSDPGESSSSEDDAYYAQFEIPDDLVW